MMLAYPLLMPDVANQDPLEVLKDAAELSRDEAFRAEREAFFDWLRGYLSPFQRPDLQLGRLEADIGSLKLAKQRLRGQLEKQAEILQRKERAAKWDRLQWVLVGAAASAGVVAAIVAVPPLAAAVGLAPAVAPVLGAGGGVGAAISGFGGWLAGRKAAVPPQPRALNGVSMFTTASETLDFEVPILWRDR